MSNTKTLDPSEDFNDSIVDLKIEQIIPNAIDNYMVTIMEDGHHTIGIPMGDTGIQFRAWYRGRGGIFAKDVLDYTFNRTHGQYVLIKSKTLHCIARLVSDDEELQFRTLKLISGTIKDRPYMILKTLDENERLTGSLRSNTIIEIEDDDLFIPSIDIISENDEELEHRGGSVSLFSE